MSTILRAATESIYMVCDGCSLPYFSIVDFRHSRSVTGSLVQCGHAVTGSFLGRSQAVTPVASLSTKKWAWLVRWLGVIILRNGTERSGNMEQLCKSSLQCLISTSCISLNRAQQPLHAGTKGTSSRLWWLGVPLLVPLLLGSLCLERTGYANRRAEAHVRLTLVVTLTLKFQQYEYQHVGLLSDMQLVEIRHCSEDLHSCSVFSECSVP